MMATQTQAQPQASLSKFVLYFLKLGCIGFGGPIALVGDMQKNLVEERKWIGQEDNLNVLAFSHFAPARWAAQLATYLGLSRSAMPEDGKRTGLNSIHEKTSNSS